MIDSETFSHGGGVAVRLPAEVALPPGIRVEIERRGGVLTIRPALDAVMPKARVERLAARLRALGPADEIEPHAPFDGPERPGLI